jgi:hypothetical protein
MLVTYSAAAGSNDYPLSGMISGFRQPFDVGLATTVATIVAAAGRRIARGLAAIGGLFCMVLFGVLVVGCFQLASPLIGSIFAVLLVAQATGISMLIFTDRFFDEAARARRSGRNR